MDDMVGHTERGLQGEGHGGRGRATLAGIRSLPGPGATRAAVPSPETACSWTTAEYTKGRPASAEHQGHPLSTSPLWLLCGLDLRA